MGGTGGIASISSTVDWLEQATSNGGTGTDGKTYDSKKKDVNKESVGGISGSVKTFGGNLGGKREISGNTTNAGVGGGGWGGYKSTQSGSAGGNGQVRFVITYVDIVEF